MGKDDRSMKARSSPLAILKSHFGHDYFRPLQEAIIGNVISQRDTLVLMPTGGGKSLCYQLPALYFDGLSLVISPLIALMKDQVDTLKANGIAAEFINSTLPSTEIARVQAQAQGGQIKILYVAPERLVLPKFRDFLRTLPVSLIAIDEAHCISEWGHEFRPEYRNLKILRADFPAVPVISLTATATTKVREDIIVQLGLQQSRTFLASFNRANLTYLIQPKRNALANLIALLQRHENEPAIIYCFSRKETEDLAAELNAQGLKAVPYHAGLDNSVRKETQEKFIRDEVPIIVATIAFGMGIDKPDIRLVVHYALPKSLEGYYQETGRAGRDGLPAECVLFYSYGDKIKQDFFINQIEDDLERQNARQKLEQIVEFCELQTCRRKFLLEYFGERWEKADCGGCDVCLTPKEEFDATEISQKIISTVIRTGQRFGAGHISSILRGSRSKRVLALGHDQLSVSGIAQDSTDDTLKQIIGLLLARGLLAKNEGQYPTFAVTEAGRLFLQRRESLVLVKPKAAIEVAPARDVSTLEYETDLFELARGLRKRIADNKGMPPYMVFSDTSLQEMAYYLPQSLESFARINGVGTVKLGEYGEEFLALIRHYSQEQGMTERPIPSRRRQRNERPIPQCSGEKIVSFPRPASTYEETKKLFLQKLSISEIANLRGLAKNTILGHLERLVLAGERLEFDHLIPSSTRFARIEAAFQETANHFLAPVRELLGEEYSYEELHLVRLCLRQRQGIAS